MVRKRNPKDIVGSSKPALHLIPGAAMYHAAAALSDGAAKYGPFNWRKTPIELSSYLAAAERHMKAFQDGEDRAQDSLVHHLGHAVATLMIVLDAESAGTLIDDRPLPGGLPALLAQSGAAKK